MKNEVVLITGSSGAIGGALKDIAASEFSDRVFEFHTHADCDLTDLAATAAYVAAVAPTAIIHLAARAGGVGMNRAHPATLLRENTLMSVSLLEAARAARVGKVVMTLSSGIYPKDAPLPLRESSLHRGEPDDSNYGYAFAKRLIEPMIRAYRNEYGMRVIGLLPNNVIGEHSSFREQDSGVVPALIRRFYEQRDGEGPLVVWGDGTPLREISYAKDIARIFMWCLDHYDDAQIVNVGTNEEISIRDIAHTVADVLGIDRDRITFDATKPNGPRRKSTDTSLLAAMHPFAYTSVHEAIGTVTRYYADHSGHPGLRR